MKRISTLFLTLVSIACLWAADFQSGDLYYNITGNNTVEVASADANIVSANIPSSVTHNGTTYSVTGVHELAFKACKYLTTAVIPNSVTSVGAGVFYGCSALESVVLSNKITALPSTSGRVPNGFFHQCKALKSIVIPNSVKTIGKNAFNNCTDLATITIGTGVTEIGDNAMKYCIFAKKNFINNSSLNAEANGYWGARIMDDEIDGMIILHDTIIECRNYASSITIPDGVIAIAHNAFSDCAGLQSITIGKDITYIAANAFENCKALNTVYWNAKKCASVYNRNYEIPYLTPFEPIQTQITTFVFGKEVEIIPQHICCRLSALSSITIPKAVNTINRSAFTHCNSLKSITVESGNAKYDSRDNCNAIIEKTSGTLLVGCKNTVIPTSVKRIGMNAFAGCSGLQSITIPNNVVTIGVNAFTSCSSLQSIILSNTLDTLDMSAFWGCTALTSITIPKSVRYIGEIAIYNTPALQSMSVEAGNAKYDSRNNCNAIIEKTTNKLLFGCQNTVIPSTVTSIEANAFYNCSNLQSITIPSAVTSIGRAAFHGCYALKHVTIPRKVTTINDWTFGNCTSLQEIKIHSRVDSVGEYAFQGCSSAKKLIIGSGVKSIKGYAFDGCNAIDTIYCYPTTPPSVQQYPSPFAYTTKNNALFLVPCESLDAYRSHDAWGLLIHIACFDPAEMPEDQGDDTAIEDVVTRPSMSDHVQKIFRNGQMYILHEGTLYNTVGQVVE